VAIANCDVEHGIGTEEDPARQVAACLPRVRNKNFFDVGELGSAKTSACNGQSKAVAITLRVGNVNHLVLREFRMQHDKVQRVAIFVRRSPDGVRKKDSIADHPQLAILFRNENSAAVRKCQAPRMVQTKSDGNYADL